jgi:hypothetical protein
VQSAVSDARKRNADNGEVKDKNPLSGVYTEHLGAFVVFERAPGGITLGPERGELDAHFTNLGDSPKLSKSLDFKIYSSCRATQHKRECLQRIYLHAYELFIRSR